MRINIKKIYFFSVPFNREIANLNINLSRHIIVILQNDGNWGVGEGVLYKGTTLSAVNFYRKSFKPDFETPNYTSFQHAREEICKRFANVNPGLTCAFDLALWDLESKIKKKSLPRLLKASKNKLSITEELFLDNLNQEHLSNIKKHGAKRLKIKIGPDTISNWKSIKHVLNTYVGEIRADANRSFNLEEFSKLRSIFRKLNINEIEEPIKSDHLLSLKDKRGVILDESVLSMEDLRKYLKKGFKIFNLKFSRLGGLTACKKYQKEIEKWGGQIVVGCSEELGIATYAQLSFAASIKKLHSVEGIGPERLKFDIIKQPFVVENGQVILRNQPAFSEKKLLDASRKLRFPVSVDAKLSPAFILFEIRENLKGKLKNLWLKLKT